MLLSISIDEIEFENKRKGWDLIFDSECHAFICKNLNLGGLSFFLLKI